MIPAASYENTAGSWDAAPNIEPNGIVDSVTYTYTFGQTHSGGHTSGGSMSTKLTRTMRAMAELLTGMSAIPPAQS